MDKCLIASTISIYLSVSIMGCSVVPNKTPYLPPQIELSGQFSANTEVTPYVFDHVDVGWIASFNDPLLDQLVQEVMESNYDLQISAANIESAAASAKQAGAALTPAISLGLDSKSTGTDSNQSSNQTSTGASLTASWEIDVWGRVRAGKDAATEELVASQLDYKFAKLSLAAQTAKAYFLAIETKRQLDINEENVNSYTETLNVVRAFFQEGLVSAQDIHISRTEQAFAKESLDSAKAAHISALRSLEALLGRYPSAEVEIFRQLPEVPKPIAVGIPSEVLERRPDIVAAERRVAAAFNNVKQAKAAKLPKLSISASVSDSNNDLSSITNPSNIIWNTVTNLMFPIFDGGQLDSQLDAANAAQKQAIAAYQQVALEAFVDIENSLSNENFFRSRHENLKVAFEQAQIAEFIARDKYEHGEGDLLDVLQLQRSTFSAYAQLINIENELLTQRINLNLALGGAF